MTCCVKDAVWNGSDKIRISRVRWDGDTYNEVPLPPGSWPMLRETGHCYRLSLGLCAQTDTEANSVARET
jgi:hypothetical protein